MHAITIEIDRMPADMNKFGARSLGLPVQWLAEQAGGQRRAGEYWESGRSRVPDDVAQRLISLDCQFVAAVRLALLARGQPVAIEYA